MVTRTLGATSVRQLVTRFARTIRSAGEQLEGYFATRKDADNFEAELTQMLVNQDGAFNSSNPTECRSPDARARTESVLA